MWWSSTRESNGPADGYQIAMAMDKDALRPLQPVGTPWTVGRMVADTCIWIAWRDPNDPERPSIMELLRLRRDGRVEIAKTDTVDTERTDGVSDAMATDRILDTAGIMKFVAQWFSAQPA